MANNSTPTKRGSQGPLSPSSKRVLYSTTPIKVEEKSYSIESITKRIRNRMKENEKDLALLASENLKLRAANKDLCYKLFQARQEVKKEEEEKETISFLDEDIDIV